VAADDKPYLAVSATITDGRTRGRVLTSIERINEQKFILLELLRPGQVPGATNVMVYLTLDDALLLAEKMLQLARQRGT
jgi:hypothetical protein